MKRASAFILVLVFLFLQPVTALGEAIDSAFTPNNLIPDTAFIDINTYPDAASIQAFLVKKGSVLANTSSEFIAKLREPISSDLKLKLDDPGYGLSRQRTAAELIFDASRSSGMNPQVILVTLHKEQSLMSGTVSESRLQRALDHAMGFACPDSGGCDGLMEGFYFQLFGNLDEAGERYLGATRSLMRSFNTPGGRGPSVKGKPARVGDTVMLANTLGGFDGIQSQQSVTIENRATAALYRYTPHVFNGNYNFWRFYKTWFKTTTVTGTFFKDANTSLYYILEKGVLRQMPEFVARARKLDLKKAATVASSDLANYPRGPVYSPVNKTIVELNGQMSIFIDGVRYPASALVLRQKKYNPLRAVRISQAEAAQYTVGPAILPLEGTLIKTKDAKTLYLVEKGTLKILSKVTTKQYAADKKVNTIASEELKTYVVSGYKAPKDGTLVRTKGDPKVYLVRGEEKHPSNHDLFFNRQFKRSDVVELSGAEMASLPMGSYVTPRNGTYFKVKETNQLYLFSGGKMHFVEASLARRKRLKAKYTFDQEVIKGWEVGGQILK